MGAHGNWRCPRTSNPLAGSNKVRGEFDPHALPQIYLFSHRYVRLLSFTFENFELS
jgi:hypothetical protein